jgi:predicted ATP-grasp superfamily ATP-dependent carboligase
VSHFIPLPNDPGDEEIVDLLIEAADTQGLRGSVLFPGNDEQVRIVAQHAAPLAERYVLTAPPWKTVECVYDKRLTHELARRAGLAVPQTYVPGSADRLADLDVEFPLILKPAVTPRFLKYDTRKAYRADNRQELVACFQAMSRAIGPSEVIVQELLPDPSMNLFSFAGYFRQGEPVAGLSARRVRQFPADFGMYSTLVETVDVPELRDLATKLLQHLDYTGLAEVEFMWDPRQSCFKLLEVNARLWAWHSLAIAAGVDLPYVAFADALGESPPLGTVRNGVKWVKLLTDVRGATHEIRAGRLGIREYLSSLRGVTGFAVASRSDPAPFIAEVLLAVRIRLERLLSRAAGCLKNIGLWRKTDGTSESLEPT